MYVDDSPGAVAARYHYLTGDPTGNSGRKSWKQVVEAIVLLNDISIEHICNMAVFPLPQITGQHAMCQSLLQGELKQCSGR